MLSTENPPDPPCSCKVSGLNNDDRPSDKLALLKTGPDDDDNKKLPSFSIRDYVFTSRRKNIGTNWPFPQQYLQLCLQHGVKGLLPPFEPPDSVRDRFCGSDPSVFEAEGDEVNENVLAEHESCKKTDYSVVRSFDQAPSPSSPEPVKLTFADHVRESEVRSTVISHEECQRELAPTIIPLPCPFQEAPTTLSEVDVLEEPLSLPQKNETTVETSGKKYRLVVKLGSISDSYRTEHVTSNTTTISDPMASKVCPVCKTFSSTSNTTLNAHIDQCLSVESTSKWAIDAARLTKHRIKPRKMRSMPDIYVTAPRCTLEDLDRRNGSNWATDCSLLNTEAKAAVEGKRKRSPRAGAGLLDAVDEGSVYFDSNGTKVRILSKFCDPSVSTLGEDSRSRRHVKDGTPSKTMPIDKKICLGPKHASYLKPKIQNKKSCHPLLDGAGIPGALETKHGMDKKQETEECLSQLLKTRDQTTQSESGTLRQWVCSKRTGLLKKLNGKYSPRGLGYSLPMTRDPLVKSNQSDRGNSFVEGSHVLKFRNTPEDTIASPNSKYVESVSYGCQISGGGEKKSSKSHERHLNQLINGRTLSSDGACASRSSGKFSSYPRSKRIEVHADRIKRSNSLPKMTSKLSQACHLLSIRARKSSSLRNGLSVQQSFPNSKSNKSRKHSTLKKSRMHRSIAEMAEQVPSSASKLDGQYNHMHDSSGNLSGCSNEIRRTDKFDSSSDARMLGMEAFVNELSVGGRGVHKSRKELKNSIISGREDPKTLNSSLSGSEVCGLDMASTVDSQVRVSCLQFQCSDTVTYKEDGLETGAELLLHKDSVIKISSKEAVGGTVKRSNESLGPEFEKPIFPSVTHSNSLQSIGEHKRRVFRNEPLMPLKECLSDSQLACATDVGSRIFCNSSVGLETNCGVGERNCSSEVHFARCGTVPTHVPGSSGSLLLGPGNLGSPEDHQGHSSFASSKILSSQVRHMVDRDTSGSPVSASSTISHPLIGRSESNYLEPESSVKPPEIQDKFVSGFSGASSEAGNVSTFSSVDAAERMNLDTEHHRGTRLSTEEGSAKLTDDQSCCYAQKESISMDVLTYQDSQIPRQCSMNMMVQAAKEKQVPFTVNNRPERNDKTVVPSMNGPSGSVHKLPSHGGFCSAGSSSQVHHAQSTSNPILRLMGKNLMVVNKDEDASVQITQTPPGVLNDYTDTRYCNLLGFSNVSTPGQDNSSLCRTVPDAFAIFRQDSCDPPSQCFDVNVPKGYSSRSNSETSQRSPQPPAGDHNNLDMGDFSRSSLMRHGIRGGFNLQAQERMPFSRPISSYAYDSDRVLSAPCLQNLNSVSAPQASGGRIREVIVIDDSPENEAESRMIYAEHSHRLMERQPYSPENEAESRMIYAEHSHRLRERQPSLVGNPPPTASYSNLRHMNAFSCHMASHPFSPRELSGGSRSSFSLPCPGRGNASPLEWGDNSQLSAVKLGSPFMARTPFTSHLCPTVYYSPSMS